MSTTYYGSTQLKAAAKALERAASSLVAYEATFPFQSCDDPSVAEAEASIKSAEGLIAAARSTYVDDEEDG